MSNSLTRLTPESVNRLVNTVTYTRSPSGKTILCEIMLHSGYAACGLARVVDMDNNDTERGKAAAHQKAMAEVWDYAAVAMQERMASGEIPNQNLQIIESHILTNGGLPLLIV